VIILPAAECPALDRTVIYDYYFHWDGDPDGEGCGALALGLVTLCNHSNRPSARVDRKPCPAHPRSDRHLLDRTRRGGDDRLRVRLMVRAA